MTEKRPDERPECDSGETDRTFHGGESEEVSEDLPDELQVTQSFSGRTLDAWAWIARARAAAAEVKRDKAGKRRPADDSQPASSPDTPEVQRRSRPI